jgi:hypothetical protein
LIIRKIVLALIAAAAVLAASGVMVVAAAYALFALARPDLGPAGAAGVVCAAAAVLIALVGLVAGLQARGVRRKLTRPGGGGILDQLLELARERPIVSTGALVAAAALAVRNPVALASVVKTLLGQKRPKTK